MPGVQPHGHLEGYLYFQRVPVGASPIHFQAKLVDAKTASEFGVIDIPFVRE